MTTPPPIESGNTQESAVESFNTITEELGKAQRRMVIMAWVLLVSTSVEN